MFTLLLISMSCLTSCADINTTETALPIHFKTEAACKAEADKIIAKKIEMIAKPQFINPRFVTDYICVKSDSKQ